MCIRDRPEDGTHGLITIHEGKYHQIKQMFGAVGNKITALERVSFGPLMLDPSLPRGGVDVYKRQLITPIVKAIYETMTEFDNGELRLSGINHLLQYPDYSDPEELKDLLGTLEHKEEILDLVSKDKTDDISVVIGSESPVSVMNNSRCV